MGWAVNHPFRSHNAKRLQALPSDGASFFRPACPAVRLLRRWLTRTLQLLACPTVPTLATTVGCAPVLPRRLTRQLHACV